MDLTSHILRYKKEEVNEKVYNESLKNLVLLLSPFVPHICEEIWMRLGNNKLISLDKWPKFDAKKIDKKAEEAEELISKTVSDINAILSLIERKAKKVVLYCIPKELELFKENEHSLSKELGLEFEIYAINDKDKYDPENKAKKAKLGKPAIFIE